MTISAVDRMREWANGGKLYKDTQHFVLHHADEIEREVAERFMERPVDADGVPIHLGDYLELEEYGGKRFPFRGISVEVCENGKRWTVCMSYDSYSGTSEFTSANRCHHVKPRTLEDVLADFAKDVNVSHSDFVSADGEEAYMRAAINEAADEIRELMEVGDD